MSVYISWHERHHEAFRRATEQFRSPRAFLRWRQSTGSTVMYFGWQMHRLWPHCNNSSTHSSHQCARKGSGHGIQGLSFVVFKIYSISYTGEGNSTGSLPWGPLSKLTGLQKMSASSFRSLHLGKWCAGKFFSLSLPLFSWTCWCL